MKNRLAAVGLSAGLLGGLAGGLVFAPGVAVGQSTPPPQTSQAPDEKIHHAPGEHLSGALAPLVANGTITQAQADKVIAALQAARPFKGGGHHRGHHKFHIALKVVADKLGITQAALRTALESGQSIAEVARSKNVSVQSVIDALVADAKTRLAAKVTAGELTAAESAARLAEITEKITALVNSDPPKLLGRPGRGERVRPDSTESAA